MFRFGKNILMAYKADNPIKLEDYDCHYIISSQHRRTGNDNKSIWTITFDEEVDCFTFSATEKWVDGKEAWGLKLDNNLPSVLGINNDSDELKVAKFVDGNRKKIWHGYPADPINKAQDRPTTLILKDWVEKGYITKAKMSKIRLGQSCSL